MCKKNTRELTMKEQIPREQSLSGIRMQGNGSSINFKRIGVAPTKSTNLNVRITLFSCNKSGFLSGIDKRRKVTLNKSQETNIIFCDNLDSILIYLVVKKRSDLSYFFCTLLYRSIFCFCSTQFWGRIGKSTRSYFLKKQILFSRFLQRHTCTDWLIRKITR